MWVGQRAWVLLFVHRKLLLGPENEGVIWGCETSAFPSKDHPPATSSHSRGPPPPPAPRAPQPQNKIPGLDSIQLDTQGGSQVL